MSDERYFKVSPEGVINLPPLPRDRRWQYLRMESAAGGPMYCVFREVPSGAPPTDLTLTIGATTDNA